MASDPSDPMMNSKAIRRSKSTLTRAILYRSTVFESHTAFEKLCTRLGLGFTFLEGNMSERLPSVAHVGRVVKEAFDTFEPFNVDDIVRHILNTFAGQYEGLQTDAVTVADAVIVATSASPRTAGLNEDYMVEEVTADFIAALHRAIIPPFIRPWCYRKLVLG